MEFEHSFTIPVPPEKAWDVLLDVQRVAPCMPGAAVDRVEGDDITGRVKVKVGPITMTYTGHARFVDRDPEAHTVTIEASGKEARGAGTASATVHAALQGDDGQTRVTMSTTLNVTGRPAQMGRGVLSDVSAKLITQFAGNLAAQLTGGDAAGGAAAPGGAAPGGPAATGNGTRSAGAAPTTAGEVAAAGAGAAEAAGAPEATGGRAATGPHHHHEPLDLLNVAAGPVLKRIVPVLGAVAAALCVALVARRRRRRKRAS